MMLVLFVTNYFLEYMSYNTYTFYLSKKSFPSVLNLKISENKYGKKLINKNNKNECFIF